MPSSRPLKILTLDGGGLQALATLSSLTAVCRAIADHNGADRSPAPHELFDMIAGIGTRGWIALLLGRYRLDIMTATCVYMEIASKVDEMTDPRSARRNRPFKLDQDRLYTVVGEVFQRYGLDFGLLCNDRTKQEGDQASKCEYSFAAAAVPAIEDQPVTYQLLRSYNTKFDAAGPLLSGPDPATLQITDVFAATAAAKFFLEPYMVGDVTLFDENFPQSHPISSIALDEAIGLFGENVEISVLLNIGPGIPSDEDYQELDMMSLTPVSRLARRFSWSSSTGSVLKQKLLCIGLSRQEPGGKGDADRTSLSLSEMALQLEHQRREEIEARLEHMYGHGGRDRYQHLGPAYSAETASLNDVNALGQSRSQTAELKKRAVIEAQDMVARGHVWVDVVV
ncbi:hypothetical protein H2200_004608 [Cladophialophora chaetospira]|uniref:PNPLA domain-containing protein n=1 Tax=Cladophialophora chaetospira TaxID=386627 RepID=A0AA38XDM5_9EURO|nr:hypothetical protein H2200_004608 [Cladophialophora chaetospira]